MLLSFSPSFPIRRKGSKGTTKEVGGLQVTHHISAIISCVTPEYPACAEYSHISLQAGACPRLFGNSTPSNACFCYHSSQSAASQLRSALLAAVGLNTFVLAIISKLRDVFSVLRSV